MSRQLGSIQEAFLPLRAIHKDILFLEYTPGIRSYRQILEVTGVNFALLTGEEQQSIFQGFQQCLSSLTFPVQICVRVTPLDLDAYLAPLQVSSDDAGMWVDLIDSHREFLAQQTQDYMLLERRFYLVVPADDFKPAKTLPFQKKTRRELEQLTFHQASQQLKLRTDTVSALLGGLGLHTRLLDRSDILTLYHDILGLHRSAPFPLSETGKAEAKLEDLLAPSAIRLEAGYGVIEEEAYFAAIAVRMLPHDVLPGWLYPLVMMDEIFDLIITQSPRKQPDALRLVRRKQAQTKSALVHAANSGQDAHPEIALLASDLSGLVDGIATGEERLHDVAIHLLVRGSSKEDLDMRVARITETIYTIGHYRPHIMHYEQEAGLKLALPGNVFLRDALTLESSSVATMFPFFASLLYRPGPGALMEGITPEREPIVVNWWELNNANRLIIAPSGSGKSYKTKLDMMRLYMMYQSLHAQEGQHLAFQLIVIDPEREYTALCEALGGQVIQLSPGSSTHINPFDLPQIGADQRQDQDDGDILATHIQRLHMLLDMMLAHHSPDHPNATLSVEEKGLLDAAFYEIYRRVGIIEPDTYSRPGPLLRDLYDVLSSGAVGEDTTNLAGRLRRFTSGSLAGLFADRTNADLKSPLIVFDVKSLDAELRPIGLFMIANLVWSLSFASMVPRQLVIDELMTLYRYPSGARFVDEMFQRARKMYLGITGITQNIGGLLSRYRDAHDEHPVIVNSATKILLKQEPASAHLLGRLFALSAQEVSYLTSFQRGEALMLIDRKRMHVQFLSSALEHRLASTDPQELARWEQERRAQQSAADKPAPLLK